MKRSDLGTRAVLSAVQRYGVDAYDYFADDLRLPPKVVVAAFRREVRAGHIDYGVCVEKPFLTPDGTDYLSGTCDYDD